MDPNLRRILARRRQAAENDQDNDSPRAPPPSDDSLSQELLLFQERERERASSTMALVCAGMLRVANDVYPLQDDSRFFMKCLVDELDDINSRKPAFAVEVGCGAAPSAVLLSRLLAPSTTVLACDISPSAMTAARTSARHSKAALNLARMDLLAALRPGTVDLLVFLPPYVPTTAEALANATAAASADIGGLDQPARSMMDAPWLWAGGPSGMALVKRFVAQDLTRVLAPSGQGVAYLLFSAARESVEMIERASGGQLAATVVMQCNDQALGDKMRVCVVRVERTSCTSSEDEAYVAAAPQSHQTAPQSGGPQDEANAWRSKYSAKHPEEARQNAA